MDEKIKEIKKISKYNWVGLLTALKDETTVIMSGHEMVEIIQTLLSECKRLEILLGEAQQWIDSEPDWKDQYHKRYFELIERLKQVESFKDSWVKRTEIAETRIKELEPDALYLRKWREIKGSNPRLPCACQVDDDTGKLISQCRAHKEIIDGYEERIKELEKEKKGMVKLSKEDMKKLGWSYT